MLAMLKRHEVEILRKAGHAKTIVRPGSSDGTQNRKRRALSTRLAMICFRFLFHPMQILPIRVITSFIIPYSLLFFKLETGFLTPHVQLEEMIVQALRFGSRVGRRALMPRFHTG
jgi:hypothetical protein